MFKIKMMMLMATIIMTIFLGSADHDVITMMMMTMIMVMTMMATMMMMIKPVYHGASVADHRTHCGPARFASNDLFFLAIPTRVILIVKRLLS